MSKKPVFGSPFEETILVTSNYNRNPPLKANLSALSFRLHKDWACLSRHERQDENNILFNWCANLPPLLVGVRVAGGNL